MPTTLQPCTGKPDKLGRPRVPCIPCLRRVPGHTAGRPIQPALQQQPDGSWTCEQQRTDVLPVEN